VSQYISLF